MPAPSRDPLVTAANVDERDDDVQDRVAVGDVVAGPDRVVAELLRRPAHARGRRPGRAAPPTQLAAALDAERDLTVTARRRHAFS